MSRIFLRYETKYLGNGFNNYMILKLGYLSWTPKREHQFENLQKKEKKRSLQHLNKQDTWSRRASWRELVVWAGPGEFRWAPRTKAEQPSAHKHLPSKEAFAPL